MRGLIIPDAGAGAAIHRNMLAKEAALAQAKALNPEVNHQLDELNSREILEFIRYRVAARLGQTHQDADDVAHDVWLRAKQAIERGVFQSGEGSNFRGWLNTIIVNFLNTKYRQDKRTTPAANETLDTMPSPRQDYEEWEKSEDGRRLLAKLAAELPETLRKTFLMRHQDELEYAEIAHRLGVPAGTIMSRLSRAKALLRKLISAKETPARDKAA